MRLSLRAGAMLAAGSLAVHELRFLAGYGGENSVGGHGYLAWAAPLLALLIAAACGAWLARVGRSGASAPRRFGVTWIGAAGSLLATYVLQETVEGLTSTGHPGLTAHGGWIAVPAALLVGGLVALMLAGVQAADRAAAVAAKPWSPVTLAVAAHEALAVRPAGPHALRPRILARRLAGRGPPLAS
jgi:hypothetical protein